MTKAFPLRVIKTPIPHMNSVSKLLADKLDLPSSVLRQQARKVFDVMAEEFEYRKPKQEAASDSAVRHVE